MRLAHSALLRAAPKATPLPLPEPELLRCAEDIARIGVAALALLDASVLCICDDGPGQRPIVVPFSCSFEPMPALTSSPPGSDLDLASLQHAARALLKRLRLRWPAYATPGRLGVVTDGTGLGFAPDDPSPLASEWIARQALGRTGFTEIKPFDPRSAWSMLVDLQAAAAVH